MGRPMALNLLAAGHRLAVWARREEALQPLVAAGALPCDGPAAVARAAPVVFTMLGDTADVEEVVLGAEPDDPRALIAGAAHPTHILTDPVENDNRVVYREPDDRQQCGEEQRVNFPGKR